MFKVLYIPGAAGFLPSRVLSVPNLLRQAISLRWVFQVRKIHLKKSLPILKIWGDSYHSTQLEFTQVCVCVRMLNDMQCEDHGGNVAETHDTHKCTVNTVSPKYIKHPKLP